MNGKTFLVLFSLFALGNCYVPATRNFVEDQIREALEVLRQTMITGDPENGVPVLDPYHIEHQPIAINETFAVLNGETSDVNINKLSTFVVETVTVNLILMKATININFPDFDVQGNYLVEGHVLETPLSGEGPYRIDHTNTRLHAMIDVAPFFTKSIIHIQSIELGLHVDDMKVNLENIVSGEHGADEINAELSAVAAPFVNQVADTYLPMIAEAIKNAVNGSFRTMFMN